MTVRLTDPAPESDRRRFIETPPESLRMTGTGAPLREPPVQTAMNTPTLEGLRGPADPTAGHALFGGMFDGAPTAARDATAVATAVPKPVPHNGYNQQDLNQLYSDKAGYTAADRQYKELDFWVNRVAEGEGRFNSSGDLNDKGMLSVGIMQWTQASGRLGKLMQAYRSEAQRENNMALYNSTFGGEKHAASLLSTLNGGKPGSLSSASLQSEFAQAGNQDTFKRAQVDLARHDVKEDLEKVNGMVPEAKDGTVSGKQLAAALIMNNIGPGSPTRIFNAVDQEMYSGIKDKRPDVNRQLSLSTDAKLEDYQYEHREELKGLAPAEKEKRLSAQRDKAQLDFYGGLAGKYGDVSAQANQQTEAKLAKYEKDHGLDPNNPAQKAQIDKARADIGIAEYAGLVSKGPTIGQRVDNEIKSETDAKISQRMDEYQKAQAAKLAAMNPQQRASAIAAQRATVSKQVGGQMGARRGELQREAVHDNVSEKDYNDRLITAVPRHLYGKANYAKFHRGLENRLRNTMGEIDLGHRVNLDKL